MIIFCIISFIIHFFIFIVNYFLHFQCILDNDVHVNVYNLYFSLYFQSIFDFVSMQVFIIFLVLCKVLLYNMWHTQFSILCFDVCMATPQKISACKGSMETKFEEPDSNTKKTLTNEQEYAKRAKWNTPQFNLFVTEYNNNSILHHWHTGETWSATLFSLSVWKWVLVKYNSQGNTHISEPNLYTPECSSGCFHQN